MDIKKLVGILKGEDLQQMYQDIVNIDIHLHMIAVSEALVESLIVGKQLKDPFKLPKI